MSNKQRPATRTAGKRTAGSKASRRYQPCAQDRRVVEALAGYGVPPEEIGRILVNPATGKALNAPTLLRHFGDELARGLAKANAQVAESLYRLAVGQTKIVVDGEVLQEEREPKVMATLFWAKTRMGWSEGRGADDAAGRAGPILAEAKVTFYIPENGRGPAETQDRACRGEQEAGDKKPAEENREAGAQSAASQSGKAEAGGAQSTGGNDGRAAAGPAGTLPRDAG